MKTGRHKVFWPSSAQVSSSVVHVEVQQTGTVLGLRHHCLGQIVHS